MALMNEVSRQEKLLKEACAQGRVIGLYDVTSEARNRVDIDEMLTQEPKIFNLYLLALEYLQDEKKSKDDKMSYFEIAGIHGLPLKWWDGVVVENRNDGKTGQGSYCPHGTILFPTWHRPYLAMMEQSIYYRILQIAQEFKDPEYLQAALKFRLPYWDYFRPRGGKSRFPGVKSLIKGCTDSPYDFSIPHILEVDEIMVVRPGSEDIPETMNNPLYQYRYPKTGSIPDAEWRALRAEDKKKNYLKLEASRSRTVRHATDYNNQKSDYLDFNSLLAKSREDNVQAMLNMLCIPGYKRYIYFSHSSRDPDTGKERNRLPGIPDDADDPNHLYGSIESIHNRYHGLCGGEGHMSRVPVAAFDPIFWLHHCNIDRIFAIWQAINPGYEWPSPDEMKLVKSTVEETDPLYPFRTPVGGDEEFWNSRTVRDIKTFGYTFAELEANKTPDALNKAMHIRYQWSLQQFKETMTIPEDMKPINVSKALVYQYPDRTLRAMLSRENPKLKPEDDGVDIVNDHTPVILTSKVDSGVKLLSVNSSVLEATNSAHAAEVVVVKDPSSEIGDNKDQLQLSEGMLNRPDFDLLKEGKKPEGTQIVRDWYVDSLVERSAFNGAFTIYYFVGDFPSDFEDYAKAPTFVGLEHIFAAPVAACDNCGIQADQQVKAANTSPITAILLDYIRVKPKELPDLQPKHVVPFLRANLHWRVVGINRQPRDAADVSGLKVSVSSTASYYHPETVVPEYIGGQSYPEVTLHRAGGLATRPSS